MRASLSLIEDVLRGVLPVGDARFELRLASGEHPFFENEEGSVVMRVELVVFADGGQTPRDVSEQELFLVTEAQRADGERLSAYLRAWIRAVPTILDRCFGGKVDAIMPHDLLFAEALDEVGARDEDDFRALFESAEVLARWIRDRADVEFAATMEHFGLAALTPALRPLERSAVRLVVDAHDEAIPMVGASRLGGMPDLPAGTAWPRVGDVTLSFLAQIRLADLANLPGAGELPSEGMLSFFYDPEGSASLEGDSARVLYFDSELDGEPTTFVRALPGSGSPRTAPAFAVRYEPERMMPSMESPFYEVLDDEVHDSSWYARFSRVAAMSDIDTRRPIHRLLGYTSELEGDPYLEAQVHSRGQSFDGWQRGGSRERALQREATRWRLLLQIDSKPNNTFLNQDGGFLYFMILDDDLAARRFDRVWVVSHGH